MNGADAERPPAFSQAPTKVPGSEDDRHRVGVRPQLQQPIEDLAGLPPFRLAPRGQQDRELAVGLHAGLLGPEQLPVREPHLLERLGVPAGASVSSEGSSRERAWASFWKRLRAAGSPSAPRR